MPNKPSDFFVGGQKNTVKCAICDTVNKYDLDSAVYAKCGRCGRSLFNVWNQPYIGFSKKYSNSKTK